MKGDLDKLELLKRIDLENLITPNHLEANNQDQLGINPVPWEEEAQWGLIQTPPQRLPQMKDMDIMKWIELGEDMDENMLL